MNGHLTAPKLINVFKGYLKKRNRLYLWLYKSKASWSSKTTFVLWKINTYINFI